MQDSLKGSDAVLMKVSRELSLHTSLKLIYARRAMVDELQPINSDCLDCDYPDCLLQEAAYLVQDGIKLMNKPPREVLRSDSDVEEFPNERMYGVTNMSDFNTFAQPYVAYGNDAQLTFVYGNVCLLVRVGPYGASVVAARKCRAM
ncbi:hypothetical protein NEOLEDRAFT_1135544 [Neolentinus lepideus HHB14362 ss-1]|uniref:Uncharacterized protein n=1 Tax=Neolentinus lepideus HHB14362 ss-1 TaxID=1314782 RepID=A0A165RMJ5_9AGAM|nr:hypothetical protein NEOLEDRAFT_1135544 [Neolentinus lepideus HHB14362 ss-1]